MQLALPKTDSNHQDIVTVERGAYSGSRALNHCLL